MELQKIRIFCLALVLVLITGCKESPLIGSTTLESGLSSNSQFESVNFWLTVGNSQKIFTIVFYGEEQGQITALVGGDPFVEVAGLLSNGQNDEMWYGINTNQGGGSAVGNNESKFFYGDNSGESGIDFEGYNISRIELVSDEIEILQDPGWTHASYKFTLNVYGDKVPAE